MKIEGKNACREALLTETTIDKMLVQNGVECGELIALAKKRNVKIQYANKQVLDEQSATKKHQGVILYTSDFVYSSVDDIVKSTKDKNENLLLLILDGIEDPHNLGSILRVAECAGVSGVIIPKHRAVSVNETVAKVSAGAISRVKVARVTNINDEIKKLKEEGVFVFVADMDGSEMYKTNLTGDIALVIGSEGFGVSTLTKKLSDGVVSIPMFG
ncbi:MAG: 23S rRNA (guanosine(2251)-2'-O)-methyltransferase RlmB, partial [Clostridia bacterium]|nr:23S rRNA (guanosine(2251)-2'-O)-methyltransferase RlmB [Clostridia bacterium]